MAIYQKSGKWWVDIYIQKRRIRKLAGRSKKNAEALLRKLLDDKFKYEKMGFQNPGAVKIGNFLKRYFQYCDDNKTRETARCDRSRLKSWQEFFDSRGIKYLAEIRPLLVEDFKSKKLRNSTPATFNKYLDILRASLNKAVEWELIPDNPIKKLKGLKSKTARKIRFFSKEEIQEILENADGFLGTIIRILLYTGMRSGELVNLIWEDIDFKNRLIHIQSKEKFTPKSKKPRSIPINQELFGILKKLPRNGRYVFDSGQDQPLCRGQVYYDRFVSLLRRLGIKGRLHDLRHTFASHLVMNGISLKAVQELLGHSSITMTEVYAHLSPGILQSAVESLKFV